MTCLEAAVHASAERGLVGCSESAVADGSRGQSPVDHPPSAAAPDAKQEDRQCYCFHTNLFSHAQALLGGKATKIEGGGEENVLLGI